MDWEPDGLSFKPQSKLPSLMSAEAIDDRLNAIASEEDEIKPTPEKDSPLVVIASQFPHISARIIEFWGSASDFNDYLTHVVVMDRSDRRGFDKEVLEALLNVWEMHRDLFDGQIAKQPELCPWSENIRLHKSFKKLDQEVSFIRRTGLTGAEAALLDAHLLLKLESTVTVVSGD